MREKIKEDLLKLKDENYKEFSLKLLPGVKEDHIIGVRIPILRKEAKKIIKNFEWESYLLEEESLLFEEKMLQGMIIGLVDIEPKKRLEIIDKFLPKIDNWSLCDSFCSSLKFASIEENQKLIWEYIKGLFKDDREYTVRFAAVLSLNYFINEDYLDELLNSYISVNHNGYYAKMAVAWGISMAYVKYPKKIMEILNNKRNIEKFTYNKAIQKIIESRQVTPDEKERLKLLRRDRGDASI